VKVNDSPPGLYDDMPDDERRRANRLARESIVTGQFLRRVTSRVRFAAPRRWEGERT
jgi:hypothetical protein